MFLHRVRLLLVGTLIWVSLSVTAFAQERAAQERVALVIGNGKYVNASQLPNPANDAHAVAAALKDIGFDVAQGEDRDRSGMEGLLREFLRKASSAKVALLFFAGHGMQVDGRNYLIPVDAKLESISDLNWGTIELDRILASLDDPARATIIILDACRDNPLARSLAARLLRTRSTAVGAGLAGYSALGSGTLIAFATAPGQVALDGDGANSPFTEGLVRHLRTPGLEVRQMLTRVRADVATATRDRQVPWDNSSLRGDVYLAGSAPVAPATVTVPGSPADQAAQVWAVTQSAISIAILEDFIRQFGATPYGSLARARLEELRASQRAAATIAAPPPVLPAPSLSPSIGDQSRAPSRREECLEEFRSKIASGDLPASAEPTAYVNWCAAAEASTSAGTADASAPGTNECLDEFRLKVARGDLPANAEPSGYLRWCAAGGAAPPSSPASASNFDSGSRPQDREQACREEFFSRVAGGDLPSNSVGPAYVAWCVSQGR